MEHSVYRKRKREDAASGDCYGASSSGTSTVIMGSWVNLKKLTGADLILINDAMMVNENEWKTSTENLETRLQEHSLKLVEDGHLLHVVADE